MSGVAVTRIDGECFEAEGWPEGTFHRGEIIEPGRWFPEAEAAALVAVVEAADTLMRTGRGRSERARIPLLRALDRLDEARR